MDRTVTFLASLPDKSGISRHSDGATVRFDVPETEIAAMAPLLALTRCVLRIVVTVEATDPLLTHVGGDDLPRRGKGRVSQRVVKQTGSST